MSPADARSQALRWAGAVRADSPTLPEARALVAAVLSRSGAEALEIVAGFLLERDRERAKERERDLYEARRQERGTMAFQILAEVNRIKDTPPLR